MIWADTDAYCVRKFETDSGHFHGWESDRHVNGGVLGLPADSETLQALLAFTRDEFAIPPWYDEQTRAEYAAKKERGEPVHAGEMAWGVWGPHALTHFLHETGEDPPRAQSPGALSLQLQGATVDDTARFRRQRPCHAGYFLDPFLWPAHAAPSRGKSSIAFRPPTA